MAERMEVTSFMATLADGRPGVVPEIGPSNGARWWVTWSRIRARAAQVQDDPPRRPLHDWRRRLGRLGLLRRGSRPRPASVGGGARWSPETTTAALGAAVLRCAEGIHFG